MRSRALVIGCVTAAWMFIMQLAAFAQSYPGGGNTPPPSVGGKKVFPGDDRLPRTGADVLMFILIALLILVIGFALHRASRRATTGDN